VQRYKSCFARLFAVHRHNLDFVGVQVIGVVELEGDILDDEGPNVVTEAVGI
jgi:hypothetical protein